jgi:hypothetical protein
MTLPVMYRNKQLLKLISSFPCQSCGIEDGTVVAAHSNQLRDGKGRGIKAHDYRVASLCFKCHTELDQGTKMSKTERVEFWEEAHRRTIAQLFERGLLHT